MIWKGLTASLLILFCELKSGCFIISIDLRIEEFHEFLIDLTCELRSLLAFPSDLWIGEINSFPIYDFEEFIGFPYWFVYWGVSYWLICEEFNDFIIEFNLRI